VLEGHGWDVKCVQWHPRSSVICSGSKDNLVKVTVDIVLLFYFHHVSILLPKLIHGYL